MEIITGVERRRRWSLEEKLRIVAETDRSDRGIAEIARQHEISRGLLWNWRSQVRRGVLKPEPTSVFVPVQVVNEPAPAERSERGGARSEPASADGKIDITLADGTAIRVGPDVSLVMLRRVIAVLRE
jgi:transposase-like protein